MLQTNIFKTLLGAILLLLLLSKVISLEGFIKVRCVWCGRSHSNKFFFVATKLVWGSEILNKSSWFNETQITINWIKQILCDFSEVFFGNLILFFKTLPGFCAIFNFYFKSFIRLPQRDLVSRQCRVLKSISLTEEIQTKNLLQNTFVMAYPFQSTYAVSVSPRKILNQPNYNFDTQTPQKKHNQVQKSVFLQANR